ncbi:hypothetical protein B7Z00_00580 [Candidatus Saccharibacteria bacterium 32-50-10]|nr:MAG: hypothetical protein B7Z00_00580 [Candidatus Saccharibacteria bacterium 32-50-10]
MQHRPGNHHESDVEAQLDELHEQHGDRDDPWEIAAYVGGYVLLLALVWAIWDLRGVGAVLIVSAVVAVLMFARSALVSILAIVLGLLVLMVYFHLAWQVL